MEIEHCSKCGSSDIHEGALHEDRPVLGQILWKSQSGAKLNDVLVKAILCKFCGNIDLVADSTMIGPKATQKCPYCKAVYSYHKKSITEGEVVCQNCEKRFPISDSIKTPDVLDAIEEDLGKE